MSLRLFMPAGIVTFLVFVWAFVDIGASPPFEEARKTILSPQFAHKLLLSPGDSTSLILPVRKISNQEYRLEFEKPFAFEPDSLVGIVGRIMMGGPLPLNYLVNVIESRNREVVYGFAVSEQGKSIIPCTGRTLPKKQYSINILLSPAAVSGGFEKRKISALLVGALLGSSLIMIAIGFFRRKTKPIKEKAIEPKENDSDAGSIVIGKYLFYPDQQLLGLEQEQTGLTAKESKLLNVFASGQNLVIDRHRLLKVWEDEGVITGRSLDMYVSKLRKRLQKDPCISIKNIHGKGYMLKSHSSIFMTG